jgi:hypothetical protein
MRSVGSRSLKGPWVRSCDGREEKEEEHRRCGGEAEGAERRIAAVAVRLK